MFNYNPKLLSHMTNEVPKIIIVLIVLTCISVFVFYKYIPSTYIFAWIVAQASFLYLKYKNLYSIKKHILNNEDKKLEIDVRNLFFISVYSALLWNTIIFLGVYYAPESYEYLGMIMIMGIVTGAIMSLSHVYIVYVAYFFIMAIPQTILFAQYSDGVHYDILLFSLVYTPFMLIISRSMYNSLLNNIKIHETLEKNIEELHHLSITDALTNIYNRRYFFDGSKKIIDIAARDTDAISMLMIDIDHFKNINDKYGHQIGDEVLMKISQRLAGMIRKSDILARVGGEEFAILLPKTSKIDAVAIANNICKTIEREIFRHKESEMLVTLSIGVSEITKDIDTVDLLYQEADIKLYEAKTFGRNRVC